jgi:hypothetical protein
VSPDIKGVLGAQPGVAAVVEEFAHAFGIGRHWWWDTPLPFMGLVTVPLIRRFHYAEDEMRSNAAQYTNP